MFFSDIEAEEDKLEAKETRNREKRSVANWAGWVKLEETKLFLENISIKKHMAVNELANFNITDKEDYMVRDIVRGMQEKIYWFNSILEDLRENIGGAK